MSKPVVKKPDVGISFPADAKGDRSTTTLGKGVIAAAMRASGSDAGTQFAAQCEKEKNWRFKYNKHYMNLVKVSADSPQAALTVARAGLDYLHDNFDFIDPTNGSSSKLTAYMANAVKSPSNHFKTGIIKGTGSVTSKPFEVPYKGRVLSGDALKAQLTKWSSYGTIEPDAALALCSVADNGMNLADKHFVLFGAGSAMGPFNKLLEHGATVVCIDIPGAWGGRAADMWKRLIATARASSGTIIFPLTKDQKECANDDDLVKAIGCNLTEQTGEIYGWLTTVAPGKTLTVGNYTYLDGDLHVKLSIAADAIMKSLCATRPGTGIAFLCTPTDIHVVPEAARKAAEANYGMHPGRVLEALVQVMSFGKLLQKNALKPLKTSLGGTLSVVDGLSVAQGPNYALAKRIQHWRAMIAYEDGKGIVSSHIAPSTATLSVVSNKTFGWAYGGMPYFKPFEIFQQDTTNALMAGLLVYDVVDQTSGANPKNRATKGVITTLELFKLCSLHGGVWRCAYKVDSIGEMSVIIHFLGGPKRFLPIVYGLFLIIVLIVMKLKFM